MNIREEKNCDGNHDRDSRAACNIHRMYLFLVSACLVPSFMEKLDAFEEITEKGYSEQVHTTDISENRREALSDTKECLETARGQKLWQQTDDGYELVATEFFAKENSHKWVLLLHGYTGWKEEMYPFAYRYYEQGYHVLVPDLRCQGESEGDFIGMGWTDSFDCELWLDYILEQDASAIDAVKKSTTPTLFIHGEDDAMIDVSMSEELYEAAACEKELLIVEGAGHAQSQDKDPAGYYGAIARFLADRGL